MICNECKREAPRNSGRGLCSACYTRLTKEGRLPPKIGRVYSKSPSCSIDGCKEQSIARSLCRHHYNQWYEKQTPEMEALRARWKGIKSKALNGNISIDPRWKVFDEFVSDVGLPPSPAYILSMRDKSKGYWRENCFWGDRRKSFVEKIRCRYSLEESLTDEQVYEFARTKKRKNRCGLTLNEYEIKLKEARYVCEICGNPETRTNGNGIPIKLSVDHDHYSGKIRGILCYRCNNLLGKLEKGMAREGMYINDIKPFFEYLTKGKSDTGFEL